MRKKEKEYNKSRKLRKQGRSIKYIAKELKISPSSASIWTRGIELTKEQRKILDHQGSRNWKAALETIKEKRIRRWAQYRKDAEQSWPALRKDPAFMFGLALYIGEGIKKGDNTVGIANVDPDVMVKSLEFFQRIGIPKEKLRARIHLHDPKNVNKSERFWSRKLNLPKKQLHKTTLQVSKTSKRKSKHRHPMGVCMLRANSTEAKQKIDKWTELVLRS